MTPELKSLCDRLEGYTPCLQPDICIADRHTVDEAAAKLREMAGEIERLREAYDAGFDAGIRGVYDPDRDASK